jgi:hypothetical protein
MTTFEAPRGPQVSMNGSTTTGTLARLRQTFDSGKIR